MPDRADSSHEKGIGWPSRQPHFPDTWLVPAAPRRIPDALLLVFGALSLLFLLLLILPAQRILDRYEQRLSVPATSAPTKFENYSVETEKLQQKVLDLVSASIETRLQGIEADIRANRLTPAKLQALEELKQELRILATYSKESTGNPDALIVRGGIPISRGRSLSEEQKQEMKDEIAQLKNLLYVSLVSCGAMVLLAGGYWLQTRPPRLPGGLGIRPSLGNATTRR